MLPAGGILAQNQQQISQSQVPQNTYVYLSELDNLVPSSEIAKYLRKAGIPVYTMHGLDHASFLFSSNWEDRIVSDVLRCCNAARRSLSFK